MSRMNQPKMQLTQANHIVIIGGTSGIGLALAKSYLANGSIVSIVGSNAEKIAQLTQGLLSKYPNNCTLYQCNISQNDELQALFVKLQSKPFNQLIYSAGWYLNERKQNLNQADSEKMLTINFQTFNQVFYWASEQMKANAMIDKQADKKLVCLASIAGMLNYPDSSLYAKCKGAMIATSQAYRAGLEPFEIGVTCIVSGYVDTAQLRWLNDGDASHKPFIISENEAVDEILHAIDNNLAVHCFPKQMKRMVGALRILPQSLLNRIMTWQYRKQDG